MDRGGDGPRPVLGDHPAPHGAGDARGSGANAARARDDLVGRDAALPEKAVPARSVRRKRSLAGRAGTLVPFDMGQGGQGAGEGSLALRQAQSDPVFDLGDCHGRLSGHKPLTYQVFYVHLVVNEHKNKT